jgi:hypothetical protein
MLPLGGTPVVSQLPVREFARRIEQQIRTLLQIDALSAYQKMNSHDRDTRDDFGQ